MNAQERKLIALLPHDLPLRQRPYQTLSRALGVSEAQVVHLIQGLQQRGYIRRFGAVLDQRRLGLTANCLCAWRVPRSRIIALAQLCRRQPHISHCYLRRSAEDWPYNFYTMIHGYSRAECLGLIRRLSRGSGVGEYRALFTLKKLKKVSPRYRAPYSPARGKATAEAAKKRETAAAMPTARL